MLKDQIKTIIKTIETSPQKRAILASLRSSQDILDPHLTQAYPVIFRYLTSNQLSTSGKPTYTENAVFTALKLYAINQIDFDDKNAKSFFKGLNIHRNPSLDTRFANLQKLTEYASISNTLANLMHQFKGTKNIDFPQLGQDVYTLQFSYDSLRQVMLKWAQDYYTSNTNKD